MLTYYTYIVIDKGRDKPKKALIFDLIPYFEEIVMFQIFLYAKMIIVFDLIELEISNKSEIHTVLKVTLLDIMEYKK